MAYTLTSEQIQLAQESERKYGVPASVTLGQFILESGAGTSALFQRSNNGFGITGTYHGDYVTSGGRKWRAYSSLAESFDDHGELLAKPLYSDKTKNAATVSEYIDAIAETYAPSSDGNNDYAGTLKKIVADYNLTQYDSGWNAGNLTGESETKDSDTGGVLYSVLGALVKGGAVLFLVVLAIVFFVNAFDLPSPAAAAKKAIVKKAVEE